MGTRLSKSKSFLTDEISLFPASFDLSGRCGRASRVAGYRPLTVSLDELSRPWFSSRSFLVSCSSSELQVATPRTGNSVNPVHVYRVKTAALGLTNISLTKNLSEPDASPLAPPGSTSGSVGHRR